MTDGTAFDVNVGSLTDGTAIDIDVGLTSGSGVKVISNSALTSGKLLYLKTTSGASNPVHIEADNVNNGTIARIDSGIRR